MAMVFVNWEDQATNEKQKKELTASITESVIRTSGAKGALVAYKNILCYPAAPGPIIVINWTEGHTDETKEAMSAAITDDVVKVTGISPKGVKIIFNDIPRGNLANDGRIINR